MNLACACKTWRDNIDKVEAPRRLAFARNPVPANEYQGVKFAFCPWCGMHLYPQDEVDRFLAACETHPNSGGKPA